MMCFAPLVALLSGAPLVQTGDLVYVSGVSGTDPAQVLSELASRLKPAGLGLRHVASANVYIADLATLPQTEDAWRRAFRRESPARTLLQALLTGNATVCVSAVASRKPL